MDGLSEEELARVRAARAKGIAPSQCLSDLVEGNPALTITDLQIGLMDACGASLSAVSPLGGWWPDGQCELSDDELDRHLAPIWPDPGADDAWPTGARVGDGCFVIESCIAGNGFFRVMRARRIGGGSARVTLAAAFEPRMSFPEVLSRLGWRLGDAVEVSWAGHIADPSGLVHFALVEDAPGVDLLSSWAGARSHREVMLLVRLLAELAHGLHLRGETLQGIRPESITWDGESFRVSSLPQRLFELRARRRVGGWPPMVFPFARVYSAPEVIEGTTPDGSSDTFTIALLAAEYLTGQHPFDAADPVLQIHAMASGTTSTKLPEALRSALSPRPQDRPALDELIESVARPGT